jgi:2-polyprenyl-3-methyl-5-hydroxy-6-metoxy-1,4-benzoquinol methylase
LLSEVIEHLEKPQISIREAVRVLCPGGRLLITTPNYRSFWPLMEWTIDRLNMAPKMAGEQHISRFHLSSLKRMLVEADLKLEYAGSIYNLSPFFSLVSSEQATRQLRRELSSQSALGMILVAVAVKY